jgi:hypothetical protein
MARYRNTLKEPPDVKVVVRKADGGYLARDDNGLYFTNDRSTALVFDYLADQVPEQLEVIRNEKGLQLAAEPVPLQEIYETCDRCRELFMPAMVFFDGGRYLCPDCLRLFKRPQAPADTGLEVA